MNKENNFLICIVQPENHNVYKICWTRGELRDLLEDVEKEIRKTVAVIHYFKSTNVDALKIIKSRFANALLEGDWFILSDKDLETFAQYKDFQI